MIASSRSIVRHARCTSSSATVAGPVERDAALLGEPAEVLHLVEPVGTRERRQRRRDQRQVEREPNARSHPPARPRPDSGRSGGPARRPSGGERSPPPATTGRARRGCAATAPRPGRWPAGAARASRSGRCWWRRSARRRASPARPRRRCAPSRAGRRGPTARPAPGRGRTPRPSRSSSRRAADGPSARSAAGTAPLRQPVSAQTVTGGRVGHVGERELRRPLLPRQVAEADRLGQPAVPRPDRRRAARGAARADRVRSCRAPARSATWVVVASSLRVDPRSRARARGSG